MANYKGAIKSAERSKRAIMNSANIKKSIESFVTVVDEAHDGKV